MPLTDTIQADLIEAMRRKDAVRLSVLRMIKTALTNKQVERGEALSDTDAQSVLKTLLKQRRESAEQFRQGGREDMARKEEEEVAIIEAYLPAPATEGDIREAVGEAVRETGAESLRDMGKVMKAALARLSGKTVDGSRVSAIAKDLLGAE
jgi:uncharacterized protein YqeY